MYLNYINIYRAFPAIGAFLPVILINVNPGKRKLPQPAYID